MTNQAERVDFQDDNRYATDCGVRCLNPSCPCHPTAYDSETLYIFWVEPGQHSAAQCVTCRALYTFEAPGSQEPGVTGRNMIKRWPSIHEVKIAFTNTRKR